MMVVAESQQLRLPNWKFDSEVGQASNKPTTSTGIPNVQLFHADALELYDSWQSPTVIVSDGAYGLGLFKGDPHTPKELLDWYEPHVKAWTEKSTPQTTLWFWNSEIGWATVHPLLEKHGWKYVSCHIWDKGISHIAGNSNTKTLRKFPVVTEICVQYVKNALVDNRNLQDWLRYEWKRTGLPFSKANEACGVKNAATRKYLTADHLWYFPPPDLFAKMVQYANQFGKPEGTPYFSLDGKNPASEVDWAKMRSKFYCKHGITNVWAEPPVNGDERVKVGTKSVHLNQKPLKLIKLILEASSESGDLVWEPFGGLCTAAIASLNLGRQCFSAEIQRNFYELALRRIERGR